MTSTQKIVPVEPNGDSEETPLDQIESPVSTKEELRIEEPEESKAGEGTVSHLD